MNPALVAPTGGMVGSGNMGRGPRDRHIGATVTVIKGPHKGYVGTIKDTNGPIARVELRTGNKVIMVDKEKLYRRLYVFFPPLGELTWLNSCAGQTASLNPWTRGAEGLLVEMACPRTKQEGLGSVARAAAGGRRITQAARPTRTPGTRAHRHGTPPRAHQTPTQTRGRPHGTRRRARRTRTPLPTEAARPHGTSALERRTRTRRAPTRAPRRALGGVARRPAVMRRRRGAARHPGAAARRRARRAGGAQLRVGGPARARLRTMHGRRPPSRRRMRGIYRLVAGGARAHRRLLLRRQPL